MIIKKIINQHRRDLTALYECQFCGATQEGSGYDDAYFHKEAVPEIKCKSCGKSTKSENDESYRPLSTKYAEHETV